MKYAVWFLRFLFAAWMIPAGLNHFLPLLRFRRVYSSTSGRSHCFATNEINAMEGGFQSLTLVKK